MTAQKESVVTTERFQQGLTYERWMAQIDRNHDKFVDNYEGTKLDPADVAAIKQLIQRPGGPAKCLALGEPWCPDVFRGLPVIAKLCEATGLELRIFFRDQNLDIMNEFLYKGEFQSIPTLVFYTQDMRYLGHWSERAQKARDEIPVLLSPITSKLRDPDISQDERQRLMADYAAFQAGPVWASWREAEVREVRELLEAACR